MVISGSPTTTRRRKMLDNISWDYIKMSYAEKSLDNLHSQRKKYYEFCTEFNYTPFPVYEWKMVRYATYLSAKFKSHKSVQNYVSAICTLNELNGFGEVKKSIYLKKVLDGIKRKLRHVPRRARPFSFKILHQIKSLVNFNNEKELVIWVVLLFGFHLFLRKSNLIPDTCTFEPNRQFQRRDFRNNHEIMIAHIKWAKNRQYADEKLLLPMAANKHTDICPVYWFRYMSKKIKAAPDDAAFCYRRNGVLIPVVYREALQQMRVWLSQLNYPAKKFSLHSLRRGGATTAFRAGLPSLTIKSLGDWASTCYFKYIDITLDAKMKAFSLFSLQDRKGSSSAHSGRG